MNVDEYDIYDVLLHAQSLFRSKSWHGTSHGCIFYDNRKTDDRDASSGGNLEVVILREKCDGID